MSISFPGYKCGFGKHHPQHDVCRCDTLDDAELETILRLARIGQSGRVLEREIKLLVAGYRTQMKPNS